MAATSFRRLVATMFRGKGSKAKAAQRAAPRPFVRVPAQAARFAVLDLVSPVCV